MKRALESSLLTEIHASVMAIKFFQHVRSLYDNEAMYSSSDSCHMRLENPPLLFDWVNIGIDKDIFVILGSTSGLNSFFDYIGNDGKIWHLTEAERTHSLELLTQYFTKNPKSNLVIDTWGEDGPILGGTIGLSTDHEWVQNEPEPREDSEEDDDDLPDDSNEEEEEKEEEEIKQIADNEIEDAVIQRQNQFLPREYFDLSD